MAAALGISHTGPRIPITSIASFVANTNTQEAYKQLYGDLNQLGVLEHIIHLEEDKILDILKSRIVGSKNIGGSGIRHRGQSVTRKASSIAKTPFLYIRPTTNLPTDSDSSSARFSMGAEAGSWIGGAIRGDNAALLHQVAGNCHIGTIGLLFGNGASIDPDNNTLLHCAARGGYSDTVKLLLRKGAPIGAVNIGMFTPLHLAAQGGHTGTVELLLSVGAPIEAMGKANWTPLHRAAQWGHTGTVELLLSKSASIEAMANESWTLLHLAAQL